MKIDLHAVFREMVSRAKYLIDRRDLKRNMMQFALAGDFSALANQTKAVMVFVEAHENHPAFHHTVGIHVGDFETQQLRVELNGDVDVSHNQYDVSHFADLER
jgi:hypothetical protein